MNQVCLELKSEPNPVEKDGTITFTGQNFDKVTKENITVFAENENISTIFSENSTTATLELSKHRIDMGSNNVEIRREKTENSIKILTIHNYRNLFRTYEEIDIGEDGQVTIFPNRGKVGTQVTLTIPNNKDKFSVFFLENEIDPFKYENMGEEPYYAQTTGNDGIIRVKVPIGLKAGKTYKVIITNNLDKVKEPNKDLTGFVTKQKTVGEFYV